MIRGIYTAAAGLTTATLRLGVVSNNVANASTPAYKQDRLPDELGKAIDLSKYAVDAQGRPIGSINLGPKVGVSQLDLASGPMQETANPLDLAIAGNGFFAVQSPDGQTRYTRELRLVPLKVLPPNLQKPFQRDIHHLFMCKFLPVFFRPDPEVTV